MPRMLHLQLDQRTPSLIRFIVFVDKTIVVAEQLKDDFKFGRAIFSEDILAITFVTNEKESARKLFIQSLDVGNG